MNREETNSLGFEIVAYAGDARSKLLNAIKEAQKENKEKSDNLIEDAKKDLNEAHKVQTTMLSAEARGEVEDIGLSMIHGQDHLMTTLLLSDIVGHLCSMYYKG